MKMFYKLVFVALLAATLALAGCDNDLNATVNFPAIKAPDVTATAITDGVKLEWSTDIDAEGYTVFRREGNGEDISIAYSGQNGGIHTDPSTGKYYVRDLQNLSLSSVKAGVTYTYTVKAAPVSFHKESAQKEVTVTTGTPFLARGAELDPPAAVAIELLPESNIIKVTVTPGAHGDVADGYWVSIRRDDSYMGGAWIDYLQTTGEYAWPLTQQSSGTYTAWAQTGGNDDFNPFYTASKLISAEEKFESLFGTNFSLNLQVDDPVVGEGANASTAIYYSASISLNNLKPGVAYSVERAPANKQRYATGDYAAVTLSKPADNGYIAATAGDLTTDHLGNLKVSLYDRTLPAETGYYVYRVKAVKGDATQYKSKDGYFLSVDPQEIAAQTIRISVGAKNTATAGVTNYAVTPSIYYKNILPSDGKLVIYWVKGNSYDNSYQSGKYNDKIEFTKAELEAATVTPKTISVPDAATSDLTYYSVYAQAYVEFADGVRKNISNWNYGGGLSNTNSYTDSNNNYIRYAQFVY
ncbi:MAG: hypothetical protein LBK73_05330 [Treponema sp.]|jgi:hypothetical protein|nr:hypothetical protein [Treponema sp.]